MVDQWYFEIGDGHTYGPYSMEKLQRWAAAGNLMPTHRVRNAESSEWLIAAYVPGLEQTMAAQMPATDADESETKKSLGKRILGLGRKGKAKTDGEHNHDGDGDVLLEHLRFLCESMKFRPDDEKMYPKRG